MPKGGKGKSDYEGWLIRLLAKGSDFGYLVTKGAWLRFAKELTEEAQHRRLSYGQRLALLRMYDGAKGLPGVQDLPQRVYGVQLVTADTGNMKKLSGPNKTRVRDVEGVLQRKGTWIAASRLNEYMAAVREKRRLEARERANKARED